MRNESHRLAEYILRYPARTSAEKWLKVQVANSVVNRATISKLAVDYVAHIEEEQVLNPYLRELATNYKEDT
jgi:hypothetical protein